MLALIIFLLLCAAGVWLFSKAMKAQDGAFDSWNKRDEDRKRRK